VSHYIIINGRKVKTGPHDRHADHAEEESVSYEIKYTPSHSLPAEQVGRNVAKILKLAAKIENVEGE
jgi:hypothetical protein